MKYLLTFLFAAMAMNATAQNWPRIWLPANVSTNINGGMIKKGDTVDVAVEMNRNYNDQEPATNQIRSLLFDFENQDDAFTLIQTIVPKDANGVPTGAIPNSSYSIATNYYPHYTWISSATNTTSNGNTNYNYQGYNYNVNSVQKITRITLNVNANLNNGVIFKLRFVVGDTKAGYSYNPLKMNFVAGFTNYSNTGGTIQGNSTCPFILDPAANSLLTLKMELNSNLALTYMPKVYIGEYAQDGTTQVDVRTFDVAQSGAVNIDQSWLKTNTNYFIMPFAPLDSAQAIQRKAVTVSDFTAVQNEFVNQNLDKTYSNSNMKTGMSYFAADVDRNKVFDAADVNRIFGMVTGASYLVDSVSNAWNNSVFTFFSDSAYNNLQPSTWSNYTSWKVDFKSTTANQNVNLKYNVVGDVNRSHSSQVVNSTGTIVSNAVASLNTNKYKSMAVGTNAFINTPNAPAAIEVALNNVTVLSNVVLIPFTIDTKGSKVDALQFEVAFDPAAVKFEEINSSLPNTWFIFVNPTKGTVRFGAIDKELRSPIIGTNIPFTLKFSSIGNGMDLTSQIKVTANMDASDEKGNQLGINLNTTVIKLTGYNNF